MTRLNQPFEGEAPITLKYGARYQLEPRIYRLADGTLCFWNDGGGVLCQDHAGVDYGVAEGTHLRAPAEGTVVFAGWDTTGFGNKVIIQHGEIYTLYGHLETIQCRVGGHLTTGQIFGTSGTTGNSTGPHLHWAAYRLVNGHEHFFNPLHGSVNGGDTMVHVVDTFKVTPQHDGNAVRVFDGPDTHLVVLGDVQHQAELVCNAWMFGEPRMDETAHQQDARWYHLTSKGWVASARVLGNAPHTTAMP